MTEITVASRNIPLTELYSQLQLEYLSYFLRSKIYCKDFAENYKKVCEVKREKIEKISSRNTLPSIFNDILMKERYLEKFLNRTGTPEFTYKDDIIRMKMERWDRNYYFCKGTSIKLTVENYTTLGIVSNNDKNLCILTVRDEFGIDHVVHYNNVCRIFPEDFFTF